MFQIFSSSGRLTIKSPVLTRSTHTHSESDFSLLIVTYACKAGICRFGHYHTFYIPYFTSSMSSHRLNIGGQEYLPTSQREALDACPVEVIRRFTVYINFPR